MVKILRFRGINPLRENDRRLLESVIDGKNHLHGFKSSDISRKVGIVLSNNPTERRKQSAKMYRMLKQPHAHSLIVKVPRSKRYRVSEKGMKIINTVMNMYHETAPEAWKKVA